MKVVKLSDQNGKVKSLSRRGLKYSLLIVVVIIVCYLCGWQLIAMKAQSARNEKTEQAMYLVRLALERYSVENDRRFPERIDQLVEGGFLSQMPLNAFQNRPMRSLSAEEPCSEGDFVYLPPGEDGGEDYCVLFYGKSNNDLGSAELSRARDAGIDPAQLSLVFIRNPSLRVPRRQAEH